MTGVRRFSQIPRATENPQAGDQFLGVSGGTVDVLFSLAQAAASIAPLAMPTTPGIMVPDGRTTFVNASGVISAPSSGAGVTLTSAIVTAAQLAASGTEPVQIVPPPGAGLKIVVLSVDYSIVSGSGVFTSGSACALFYGAPSLGIQACTDDDVIPTNTSGVNTTRIALLQALLESSAAFENQPLVYGNAGAGDYGGAGSVNLQINVLWYKTPCIPGSL